MDRRSLIFIIGMTIIFFLMNQWFDYGGTRSAVTSMDAPKTQVLVDGSGVDKATVLTPQEMKDLKVEKLYKDLELKEFFTYSVRQKSNYLTLASTLDMPDVLYSVPPGEVTPAPIRLQLRVQPDEVGEPILYSLYPLSKIETPWVPNEGSYDVALLMFQGDKVYKIDARTEGVQSLLVDEIPQNNALVVLKFDDNSGTYAFYDVEQERLEYLEHLGDFESYSIMTFPVESNIQEEFQNQQFYVLENQWMQLVFTNLDGALCEINLPFESETNDSSVVRPIRTDRILRENYPANDRFPQYPYHVAGQSDLLEPREGGYYPLLRRNIIGSAGDTTTRIIPHYYAFNVFRTADFPKPFNYKVTRFEKDLIEFELSEDNRRVTKTFSLPKNPEEAPYIMDLSVKIDGDARGFNMTMGIPDVELISGNFSPTLKYRVIQNQKPSVETIKTPKDNVVFSQVIPQWYCNGNGFFGIILDPLNRNAPGFGVYPISGELVPTRLSIIDAQFSKFPAQKFPGYTFRVPIKSRSGVTKYRIFAGPFDQSILKQLDTTFADPHTGISSGYLGAKSFHGWFAFISQPFAKFLFLIMDFFHMVTHSWGISIILLTVVLRVLLYPLNSASMRSMAKMSKVAPKVKAIQEKYKKDPKRLQQETMKLYKKEGVNPLGGCLPMLVQLPFILGLLDLLKSSFELRGAPFIPGWIDNLTAPDVLFQWSYPIPLIGTTFHLLPVLLGGMMFLQQRIQSAARGGSSTDKEKQQRSMGNIMTIAFTVMFYNFPSGLNIYWITSTALGILQQKWITKKVNAKVE